MVVSFAVPTTVACTNDSSSKGMEDVLHGSDDGSDVRRREEEEEGGTTQL
jgi:hypothetical protein